MKGKLMSSFKVFVTEPIPEIEFGLKILKDAEIRIKNEFISSIPTMDISDVDAIIAGDAKIKREAIEGAKKLKVIGRFGAGVDSVDLKACSENGIIVFNIPGLNAQSVAEHTIGMIIAVAKKFLSVDKLVRAGGWKEKSKYMGYEIHGKTLGIVGLGNIGMKVAKIAKAFEMKVLAYDPYIPKERGKELGIAMMDLESILKNSDIVTLHVPLTEETKGLIGEKELKSMKKTAILVNTSRGGVVDEFALYKALKEGWIAGAGIDVLENEPVEKHPLFELDNVLLTPHTASWTIEAFRRMAIKVCEGILKVMKGELPDNIVNPEAFSRKRF
jgi:D-3-phosphoglycerate dehydrogenase